MSQNYIQSLNIDGVLSLKSSHYQFISAIKTVIYGEKYICPTLIEKKTIRVDSKHRSKQLGNITRQPLLTKRQTEVLKYISSGHSNKFIAYELGVSEGTIKLHVSSILRSLKVTNRTMAAMCAKRYINSEIHAA